jgi:hypothetical protein
VPPLVFWAKESGDETMTKIANAANNAERRVGEEFIKLK